LPQRANSGFNSNTLFNNCTTIERPNSSSYLLAGEMRQRRFDGIQPEPRKLEDAQTSTRRRQAVLGVWQEKSTII
jgi:hypothetical protein